jgi:GNAT superfamily N-acetyltransferase
VSAGYSIGLGDPKQDRPELLELSARNRPGARTRFEARYVKYYENNPLGTPTLHVARDDESGSLIGMTVLFPTNLWIAGERVRAGVGGDFAVDERHRGFGPALALQRASIQALPELGMSCSFGSPNNNSELILGRAGYTDVARLTRFTKLLSARPGVDRYVSRPWLASLASGVASPFVSILSRDRIHRSPARLTVEQPERFDDRFASLCELAREQLGVTSERNPELLNWRYEKTGTGGAWGNFTIFALIEANEVAGYVVYRMDEDVRLVYDMVCRPDKPVVDALLAELIRDARRKKASAIDLGYVGPSNLLTERLRAFGFLRTTLTNGLRVVVNREAPADVDLEKADNWYFMRGDTDF